MQRLIRHKPMKQKVLRPLCTLGQDLKVSRLTLAHECPVSVWATQKIQTKKKPHFILGSNARAQEWEGGKYEREKERKQMQGVLLSLSLLWPLDVILWMPLNIHVKLASEVSPRGVKQHLPASSHAPSVRVATFLLFPYVCMSSCSSLAMGFENVHGRKHLHLDSRDSMLPVHPA